MKTKHINLTNRSKTDEIIIHFSGGDVQVTRRPDGLGYWAHISRNRQEYTRDEAVVRSVHVSCEGMNPMRTNVGDMARSDFYHVAVWIKPKK